MKLSDQTYLNLDIIRENSFEFQEVVKESFLRFGRIHFHFQFHSFSPKSLKRKLNSGAVNFVLPYFVILFFMCFRIKL